MRKYLSTVLLILVLTLLIATPVLANDTNTKLYNVQVSGKMVRSQVNELLRLINEERAKRGLLPLRLDGKLSAIAEKRAVQCSFNSSHQQPDGTPMRDMTDIKGEIFTENLSGVHSLSNYSNAAQETFDGWMNSPLGHKDAFLHDSLGPDRIGLGIYVQDKQQQKNATFCFAALIMGTEGNVDRDPETGEWIYAPWVPYTNAFTTSRMTMGFPVKEFYVDFEDFLFDEFTVKQGKSLHVAPLFDTDNTAAAISGRGGWGYLDDDCGTWRSSKPSVATVDTKGNVKGLRRGETQISFALNGDRNKCYKAWITVKADPTTVAKVSKLTSSRLACDKVSLSWPKVSNAAGYAVYRSTKASSGFNRIATVASSSASVKVTPGKTYYYKVRAYKKYNGEHYFGAYSPTVKKMVTLANGKLTSVRQADRRATIKWKKAGGASGYQIRISYKTGGQYKKTWRNINGKYSLKYTTGRMKKGRTYYVRVRAYKIVNGKRIYGSYGPANKVKIR